MVEYAGSDDDLQRESGVIGGHSASTGIACKSIVVLVAETKYTSPHDRFGRVCGFRQVKMLTTILQLGGGPTWNSNICQHAEDDHTTLPTRSRSQYNSSCAVDYQHYWRFSGFVHKVGEGLPLLDSDPKAFHGILLHKGR